MSAGIFEITSEKPGNSGHTSAVGWDNYIDGWYDATVKLSAKASLSFSGIGLEINAGYSYHQYAIIEVEGAGDVRQHAGTFK